MRPLEDSPNRLTRTRVVNIAAPLKGWNTRDPVAAMPSGFAVTLDNILPRTYYCEVRNGAANHVTGIAGQVESLLVYNSPTVSKLFAANQTAIFDVTTAGAVGAAVQSGLASGRWQQTLFSNSAGTLFLCIVNGVDAYRTFDGATWTNQVITGATSSDFINIVRWKSRLWFVKKDSMSAFYLATSSVAGAVTEFPLGPLFKLGGALLAIGVLALDAGEGVDDYICFFTTNGEVAIYKGTDPASASTFAHSGTFRIPRPIGSRCLQEYGGDLLVLTERGIYPLSKSLSSININRESELTFNISSSFTFDARTYFSTFGWEVQLLTPDNLLIANSPGGNNGVSAQYAMNTLTGAWNRIKGWDSLKAMAVYGGELYGAFSTKVAKLLSGQDDFGANIVSELQISHSRFGSSALKQFKSVKPYLSVDAAISYQLAIPIDYSTVPDYQEVSISSASLGGGVWDTDDWDFFNWGSGDTLVKEWEQPFQNPGFAGSVALKFDSQDVTIQVIAFDFLIDVGGFL